MSNCMERHFRTSVNHKTGATATVAIMDKCADIVDEVMSKVSLPIAFIVTAACETTNCMNGENPNIRAVATCSENDVPCIRTGREVSDAKLSLKYHKRMSRDCEKAIKAMQEALAVLTESKIAHDKKVKNIEDDMQRFYFNND